MTVAGEIQFYRLMSILQVDVSPNPCSAPAGPSTWPCSSWFCNSDFKLLSCHLQITHCLHETKIEILLDRSQLLPTHQPSLPREQEWQRPSACLHQALFTAFAYGSSSHYPCTVDSNLSSDNRQSAWSLESPKAWKLNSDSWWCLQAPSCWVHLCVILCSLASFKYLVLIFSNSVIHFFTESTVLQILSQLFCKYWVPFYELEWF